MPSKYCLIKSLADDFKKRLAKGEIDPEKLAKMTSAERHAFLEKIVGDNATSVNSLFEQKLLQKNKWNAMINWAKEVTGIKPEIRRDLLSRIEKMSSNPDFNILNPKEESAFLNDLVNTKLGMNVTLEEAKTISDLSQKMALGRTAWEKGGGGKDYAINRVAMERFVREIKTKEISTWSWNPVKIAENIAGNAKSMKATLDLSFTARQGLKTLWTHPIIWGKNFAKEFGDAWRGFKNGAQDAMDSIRVDVYSRDNFINGNYKKMKLDLGGVEEAFPESLGEKIPIFKRLYNASEVAYNGMGMRLRADLADGMVALAEKQGVILDDISKKGISEAQSIGRMVNSLTGRGYLGKLDTFGKEINVAFFSPKFLKSHIDVLTQPLTGAGGSNFVRKEAAKNLLKIATGTATVLFLADRMWPGSVEWDARSSNFGKIKIGDSRFNVTGGMGSLITLASRMLPTTHNGKFGFWSKSSSGNTYTQLNHGFGVQTVTGVLQDFMMGKLSPAAGLVRDLLKQQDMQGNPITVSGSLLNLFEPLPLTNVREVLGDENAAPLWIVLIADGFGISTNTYSSQTNWNRNTGAELQQFKDKVGQKEFDLANKEFNTIVAGKMLKLVSDERYKKLSDDDKSKAVTKLKANIKDDLYKKYKFTYKSTTKPTDTKVINELTK